MADTNRSLPSPQLISHSQAPANPALGLREEENCPLPVTGTVISELCDLRLSLQLSELQALLTGRI